MQIHPTAVVHKNAQIAENIEIGPYAVIEDKVQIGADTIIRPHAIVRQYTTLGKNNFVDSFAVLGGNPQDLKFEESTVSYLEIGDNNTFREGVTISRATGEGNKTVVGNNTLWMANSHAGHNATIHDNVIFVNGSLVAGHATIGKGAILPANGNIHQFCWVGDGAMFQGGTSISMHAPPYVICAEVNKVIALNSIGLRRRPDLTSDDLKQIKEAFRITYRSGLSPTEALKEMERSSDWGEAAKKFIDFISKVIEAEPPYQRGLCPHLSRLDQRRK
jgi:UDP-N-acetylglucosamine acyltransferase